MIAMASFDQKMAYQQTYFPRSGYDPRRNLIYGIITFWGIVGLCIAVILFSEYGIGENASKAYLVPWCLATGIVVISPSVYLFYKGKFDPFHPLVFPAWSYFLPGFFVGGLIVSAGLSQPYFLSFIQNERYDLPLTLVYVMLGYAGLAIGFSIPYARRFGDLIGSRLPQWDISDNRIALASLILMSLGLGNTVIGFALGILGFQKVQEIGAFDGIIYLFSLLFFAASFLLWLVVFRSRSIGRWQIMIIALLVTLSLIKSAFQGNRGSLIQFIILVAFAYNYSGLKLKGKHYAIGSALLVLSLALGMIYGTTFRSIKESQDLVGLDQYIAFVSTTFTKLGDEDLSTALATGGNALAERIDALSPTAVVVSNYESLAPYEEDLGISNNIFVDSVTFFIPRVLWADKPVSIDPAKYADLYFNFSENAFTITPMGDLLRNFGPVGVPIGMIILGMIIRVMYAALIEGKLFDYWKVTHFYMIFTNAISFEGTYSLIVPMIFKVGMVTIFGLVLVRLLSRTRSKAT
jgi:hypothetical protein